MPLKPCRDCGQPISSHSKACHYCGCPTSPVQEFGASLQNLGASVASVGCGILVLLGCVLLLVALTR